jgi:transposase InsO family protein
LLYLAGILDIYSRFAVGWAISARITDDRTLDALAMALARRRPPQELLHHSIAVVSTPAAPTSARWRSTGSCAA